MPFHNHLFQQVFLNNDPPSRLDLSNSYKEFMLPFQLMHALQFNVPFATLWISSLSCTHRNSILLTEFLPHFQ